jgi:hypothetical protein
LLFAQFSLTPGFNPVIWLAEPETVLTVLSVEKPLKRLWFANRQTTGLKPGVNEIKL